MEILNGFYNLLATWALFALNVVDAEELLIGYLTGSQRKPGDNEYKRPALTISGAISLAVNEINAELAANGSEHRFRSAQSINYL